MRIGLLTIFTIVVVYMPCLAQDTLHSGDEKLRELHMNTINSWFSSPQSALEFGLQALELSLASQDSANISKSKRLVGLALYYKGEYEKSIDISTDALKLATRLGDSLLIANTYNNLGLSYFQLGSYEPALEYFLKAIEIKNQKGNDVDVAIMLVNIGRIYDRANELDKAKEYYRKGYQKAQGTDVHGEIYALNNLGISLLKRNRYEEAEAHLREGLKRAKKHNNKNWASVSMRSIGEALLGKKQLDSVQFYYTASLNMSKEIEDQKGLSEAYCALAKFEYSRERTTQAMEYLDMSDQIAKKINLRLQQLENIDMYIKISDALGDQQKTITHQREYISLSDSISKESISRNLSLIPSRLKETTENGRLTLQVAELEKKQLENRLYAIILFITIPFVLVLVYLLNKIRKSHEELSNFNEELQRTQKLLVSSEKMASLGVMAMGIAHEINNPLNFIKNGVEAVNSRLKEDLPEKAQELEPMITIVNEGVNRATKIVKSLSHFSRKTPAMDEKCSLKDIIENCLLILHNKIKNKVQVMTSFVENAPVKGNEGRLHQAMLNIIANAVQAIEKKGTLNIITAKKEGKLEITIEDDGMGIPEENLEKITDPFFTTKPPGEGTGLGLFITLSIIEEHNGEIDVISNVGKGTIFTITLPFWQDQS